MCRKFPFSDAEIYRIFRALHERKLAICLGFRGNEPMIWMSDRTAFTREPVSIATAAMILDEILCRELEEDIEVLVGEVLDSLQIRPQPRSRRPMPLLLEVRT